MECYLQLVSSVNPISSNSPSLYQTNYSRICIQRLNKWTLQEDFGVNLNVQKPGTLEKLDEKFLIKSVITVFKDTKFTF